MYHKTYNAAVPCNLTRTAFTFGTQQRVHLLTGGPQVLVDPGWLRRRRAAAADSSEGGRRRPVWSARCRHIGTGAETSVEASQTEHLGDCYRLQWRAARNRRQFIIHLFTYLLTYLSR